MSSIFSNPLLHGYPLFYKSHVVLCLSLGTPMMFHPALLITHPLWIRLHSLFGLSYVPPSRTFPLSSTLSPTEMQHWSNLGIMLTAIGLINLAAAGIPGGRQFAR